MNVAFATINALHNGSTIQHNSAGSSSTSSQLQQGSSMTNLNETNDSEYQMGTLLVAQAIWIQQRIIRILQDDTGLLQTVCELNNSVKFAILYFLFLSDC